jgi:hypothetical protein
VHAPTEVADVAGQIHSSLQDYYTTLDLTALSIYSSEDAQRLSPAQRSCRLPHESDLSLAPAYSYSLCRLQCRMMLAYSLCSCVPHFYRPQCKYSFYIIYIMYSIFHAIYIFKRNNMSLFTLLKVRLLYHKYYKFCFISL